MENHQEIGMKKTLITILFATLALYGCSDDETGGTGGSAGTGGTAGAGGSAGMGGDGGAGGALACDSTANAFIKTLDPDAGFAVSGEDTEDTTDLPTTWSTYSVSLEITAAQVGHILQFGFQNNSSDFDSSGVFYDNVVLDPDSLYAQNFDSLDIDTSPIGDGWRFFNNVFAGDGTYKFGYGDPAPNATTDPDNIFISAIVDDQGGAQQGTQQLSVFSDYTCCQEAGPEGHFNGTDLVEVNVFQERTLQLGDVGTTFILNFDAKRGNINDECAAP
jgi:hypothetical protein